ncbi:chromosome segregation atpases-like protein [Moniliophthora roreri]|nr:chromosome segregation atpases-like protein [Moniliophthora roreri]
MMISKVFAWWFQLQGMRDFPVLPRWFFRCADDGQSQGLSDCSRTNSMGRFNGKKPCPDTTTSTSQESNLSHPHV